MLPTNGISFFWDSSLFSIHRLGGDLGSSGSQPRWDTNQNPDRRQHALVTKHICDQVGLRTGRSLIGDELDRMNDARTFASGRKDHCVRARFSSRRIELFWP